MLKTIAVYLPQFHEVKENNEWWGQGFTDWVTVKKGRPLFPGHRQPRVPLQHNYYDLMSHDVMRWQASLAQKYHIYGFCFYHYWFKGGKRILEKPAENLLQWTDINMPFCFSWANQTWARTWTNIPNSNAWSGPEYEKDKNEDGILLRQSYGGKEEWKAHFEYLLPFFRDRRYIRYEGKPVFLIYKPEYMYCLDNMMEYWKTLALQNGLKGLYVITVRRNCKNWSQVDAWLLQEFDYSFMPSEKVYKNGVWTIKYVDAWENVLQRAYNQGDKNAFLGGFTDVDDTPRRGNRGVCIRDASPGVFEAYYRKIAELAVARKRELLFVNAWNEWGEGAYLEPDEMFGYGYLEAINRVMEEVSQKEESKIVLDTKYSANTKRPVWMAAEKKNCEKFETYFRVLNKWLENKENNKKIEDVLKALQIEKIAIYGMGGLGRHLVRELEESSVEIVLYFDRRAEFLQNKEPSQYIRSRFPDIDAVIVTPVLEYREIRLQLKEIFEAPIMSLEELISECEIL